MTMDEYIKWLENRIAVIGTELETLIHARKVIEMARGELDKAKPPLHQPKPKRLTLAEAVAKNKVNREPDRWKSALDDIMHLIRVAHPQQLTSGEIISRLNLDDGGKRDKDRVYTALSYMKSKGELVRSSQGYWSLPEASAALNAGQSDD